jgi:type I site-specific restriction endonuclease
VAGSSIQIIGTRRTIVFTVSVKQAEVLCNIFNRHRQGMAEWVCGTTNKDDRKEMLQRFQDGQVQVVCNCGVLTEGFDNPGVEVIVMARPTKSRALYAQMAGRATRPLTGLVDGLESAEARKAAILASNKPSALIIDFVGNSGRHKLMTTADILGGKVDDDVLERAVAAAKRLGRACNMAELIDEEEEATEKRKEAAELARQRRIQEEAIKIKVVAKVSYKTQDIDPFSVFDLRPVKARGWDQGKTLTVKQKALLVKQGINPDKLEYAPARQLIGEMFRRWQGKLCTLKQAKLLKRFGYQTKDMTMSKASALITALASNGWRRMPEPVTAEVAPSVDDRTPF